MNVLQALREALAANDVALWSKSGAHVFNSEKALQDVARSLEVRLVRRHDVATLDAIKERYAEGFGDIEVAADDVATLLAMVEP